MIDARLLRKRFDRSAEGFDEADFVHSATRAGLLERLEPLLVDAKTVVDLGTGTGAAQLALSKRFKGARIIGVDLSHGMLLQARSKKPWLANFRYVQADASRLPFADASVDVVFSNLLLPWCDNPDPVFADVARVLKKGGLFAFTTLGPDSLQEIEQAWRQAGSDVAGHINRFADMHDVGDGLVKAGLGDPVLDVDRLTISYENSGKLFADLSATGARNARSDRNPTLTGKKRFTAMQDALSETGKIALNLELIYGHCWGQGPRNDPSHFRIDPAGIPIRRS